MKEIQEGRLMRPVQDGLRLPHLGCCAGYLPLQDPPARPCCPAHCTAVLHKPSSPWGVTQASWGGGGKVG